MASHSEYMILPSNASMKIFPQNSLANYRVKLPRKFRFDETWEVALTEITFPDKIKEYNCGFFIADQCIYDVSKFRELSAGNVKTWDEFPFVKIEEKVYKNLKELLNQINRQWSQLKYKENPKIRYDRESNLIEITPGVLEEKRILSGRLRGECDRALPYFTPALMELFGLSPGFFSSHFIGYLNKPLKIDPSEPIDLAYTSAIYYIYSSIVYPYSVGDACVQLLRAVPIHKKKEQKQYSFIFERPYYLKLSNRDFDEIEIDIRDDTGSKPHFISGRTLVTLHFRKNNG